MSAKYRKVKQADESLPAPLRWLTRAFSSITLSVILLTGVSIYGALGSLPVFFWVVGLAYLAMVVVVGLPTFFVLRGLLHHRSLTGWVRGLMVAGLLISSILAIVAGCILSYRMATGWDALMRHKATVLHRLPALEMSAPEFYAWWPLQLMLALFIMNMIWATIRRIEFKFVNLGVLTVHTGIVIMALGSVLYGQLKIEGDMFLMRQDLGGVPVAHFYDRNMPALFLSVDNAPEAGFPLPELPRYHDYALGQLEIDLHDRPEFESLMGDMLRVSIPGFYAYAELAQKWVEADELAGSTTPHLGPAITLRSGDRDGPHSGDQPQTLVAGLPAKRVVGNTGFAIEYLHNPSEERLDVLRDKAIGAHVLRVEIPEADFAESLVVTSNTGYDLGETGYTLEVTDIGPYAMPFISEGYREASDTQATVRIRGNGKDFTRIALHRYPERSQDFVKTGEPGEGPMGTRRDPDPAIKVSYLDNTVQQYRLVTSTESLESRQPGGPIQAGIRLLCRIPGIEPFEVELPEAKFPVGTMEQPIWLHLVERYNQAVPTREPVPLPPAMRDPQIEGTYEQAVIPVRIEYDLHDENLKPTGETFSRTVYLRQMPYVEQPEGELQPARLAIPGYGTLKIAFGRERHGLPFAVELAGFEMTPYPGSDIPRDFSSDLIITRLEDGRLTNQMTEHKPRLNNPVVYRSPGAPLATKKIKLSQAGWDPGDPQMSEADLQQRDASGQFINQQRFSILGVGNNVGIRIIAFGLILVVLGIPWAFYIKPWLVRRKARKFNASLVNNQGVEPQRPHRFAERKQREITLPGEFAKDSSTENASSKSNELEKAQT
jgi:hypothetical protein